MMSDRLRGVHADLVRVVELAVRSAPGLFTVSEGVRTIERQKELVAKGASKTLNSRHLTGHAVDVWCGPDWPPYFKAAQVIQLAAKNLKVSIVWGGVWDRILNDLSADLEAEQAEYVRRQKARGRRAFLDGPHFELHRKTYP